MSLYSSIDRRINADEWFRELSHLAQLLWLRLLTGQHVTPLPGLWPATESGLARAFQFSDRQFRELFAEITQDVASNGLPRVIADWGAGVIWLPNVLKQKCNQPKNCAVLLGWGKHVELVPECELKRRALQSIGAWLLQSRDRYSNPKGVKGQTQDSLDNLLDSLQDSLLDGRWTVLSLSAVSGTGTGTGTGTGDPPNPHSDHAKLRMHYAAEYQRTRGLPHKLAKSQGGRYAKAAKDLLEAYGFDESCAIVTRALEHEWQGRNACELWQIVRSAGNFRGKTKAALRAIGAPPQPSHGRTGYETAKVVR